MDMEVCQNVVYEWNCFFHVFSSTCVNYGTGALYSWVRDVALYFWFVVLLVEINLVGDDPAEGVTLLSPNRSAYECLGTVTLYELLYNAEFRFVGELGPNCSHHVSAAY